MMNGTWKGGYVIGLGYVGPCYNIIPSMIIFPSSGLEILANAEEFKDTPYKMGGCDKSGIDCSGLVTVSLRISRWTTESGDIPGMRKIQLNTQDSNFTRELQKGDILVWRKNEKFRHGHAAIYVENQTIFHAHGSEGTKTGRTSDLIRYWFKVRGLPEVYRK